MVRDLPEFLLPQNAQLFSPSHFGTLRISALDKNHCPVYES